jgi:hypothetical protein
MSPGMGNQGGSMASTPSTTPIRNAARLLELDPELGHLLGPERLAGATQELLVRLTNLDVGQWDGDRLAGVDPANVGLLLLAGVMAREVVLGDTVSTELVGPGDVIRPWQMYGTPELLTVELRWNVLAPIRAAVLDKRFAAQLGAYPEINAVIVDRLSERALRLSITQAISQLNRVDQRLLALFWHLAERWGRVARDGIAIPLVLSHRLIGELIGARRPTVSTAMGKLGREGQLVRRADGTWLLTGEPVAVSAPIKSEVIAQRRRLMPTAAEPTAVPVQERLAELRAPLAAHRLRTEELERSTAALCERVAEMRTLRRQRLDALRAAARRREQAR